MSPGVCAPAETLVIDADHAAKAARWIAECGGVAVWGCLDLADAGRRWLTPARYTDGRPVRPPHWSAPKRPGRIVTDPALVEIVERREVSRFRIAVRRGGYGTRLKLTDASSDRLRAALDAAGADATYAFEGNEAVVYGVARRWTLPGWQGEHPDAEAG